MQPLWEMSFVSRNLPAFNLSLLSLVLPALISSLSTRPSNSKCTMGKQKYNFQAEVSLMQLINV